MKIVFGTSALLVAAALQAQTLSFTSGVVSNNFNDVTLTLQGPTNLLCTIDGLDRSSQTWGAVQSVTLNSSGQGTVYTTLDEGIYGYYRAQGTNGGTVYKSTNAFGAVAGTLPIGWTMIGNPFAARTVSEIIPSPLDGTLVYKYDNTNGYTIATYESDLGGWDTNITITTAEGVLARTPTNSTQRYLVSGLFTTNAITKAIPSGSLILCSPLYQLIGPGTWQIDEMNTNRLGGYSVAPVQSSGYNPVHPRSLYLEWCKDRSLRMKKF